MTFQDGEVEYITEDAERKGILAWTAAAPWCGQTVFTFANDRGGASSSASCVSQEARQGSGCYTSRELPNPPAATTRPEAEPVQEESEDDEEPVAAEIEAIYDGPWEDMDMMFQVQEARNAAVALLAQDAAAEPCLVCKVRSTVTHCECCPNEPVSVCGSCCLLRHAEQRYEVHDPDESSAIFERIAKLQE